MKYNFAPIVKFYSTVGSRWFRLTVIEREVGTNNISSSNDK